MSNPGKEKSNEQLSQIEKWKPFFEDVLEGMENSLFAMCSEEEWQKMLESDPILRAMLKEAYEREKQLWSELIKIPDEKRKRIAELEEEKKRLNEQIDKYPSSWVADLMLHILYNNA